MSNLATIVNNIIADSGIDDINVIVSTGSYNNPAWITGLAWSKIASTPTTLAGYGITDAYTKTEVNTLLNGKQATLNGTGFVVMSGTSVSYDSNYYAIGLAADISANAVLDDSTLRNGMYRINPTVTSAPSADYWSMVKYGNQNNVVGQLVSQFVTGETYVRAYNASWSAWRKLWDNVNLPNPQSAITLTTTGSSGAATFSGNVLNIPNYGSALSGYLPLSAGASFPLTGTLFGTSANFSSRVSSGGGGGGTSSLNAQQLSGDDAAIFAGGSNVTGSSKGIKVLAGLNASDYALDIRDYSGNTIMYAAGNKNIGIGTTTPDNFNGLTFSAPILDVVGSIQIRGLAADTVASLALGGNTYRKASIMTPIGTATPYLAFSVATSGTSSNSTEYVRITSTGNVGINTLSPRTVSGFTVLSLNNSSNGGLIDFQVNGTGIYNLYGTALRLGIETVAGAGGGLYLNASNQYVSIGTTTASTALEVLSRAADASRTTPHDILTLTAEQGNAPYTGFGGSIVFKNRSYVSGLVTSSRIRSIIYDDGAPNNFGGGFIFERTATPGGTLTPTFELSYNGNALLYNGRLIVSAGSGSAYSSRISTAYNFPYVDTYIDSYAGLSYEGRLNFRTNSGDGAMGIKMKLSNSGNLEVTGGVYAPFGSFISSGYALEAGSAGATQKVRIGVNSTGYSAIQGSNTSNGATDITINPDGGNVGIGVTVPNSKFEVYRLETINRTSYTDIISVTAAANTSPYAGHGGGILFRGNTYWSGSGTIYNWGRIGMELTDSSVQTTGENMFFEVAATDTTNTLTRAMTIRYDGNVGIGTSNPINKLHVTGTPDVLGAILRVSSNTTNGAINLGHSTNGGLIGYANLGSGVLNNVFYITTGAGTIGSGISMTNDANVGINVIASNSSPYRKSLQINNFVMSGGDAYYPFTSFIGTNVYYDSSDTPRYINNSGASMLHVNSHTGGNFGFYAADSGSANAAITWNARLLINSSGNVIIGGTSSIGTKLQVEGTTYSAALWLNMQTQNGNATLNTGTSYLYQGGGGHTYTLRSASGSNQLFFIKNDSSFSLTIAAASGDVILDNAGNSPTTFTLAARKAILIQQSGGNLNIIMSIY